MKDEQILFLTMLDSIDRILRYTDIGETAFYDDEKTQDAVLRNFQLIGQVCSDISHETREGHPEIEWSDIIGFRNVIVHDYLGLDLPTVWKIIENELPPLKGKIQKLISY